MKTESQGSFISWGAGVNSTAIIALYLLGQLEGELPEVVFADTGGELPESYTYIEQVKSIITAKGWKVTILRPTWPHERLYNRRCRGKSLYDFLWDVKTVPGMKWRFCTSDYKIRPLKKYAAGRAKMIGICADELKRMKEDAIYPVRDYTRQECYDLVVESGLPPPHKTGCWFCPFQRKQQWIDLHDNHHDLWEMAVKLEGNSAKWRFFNNGLTLHRQMAKWLGERELESAQLTFALEG